MKKLLGINLLIVFAIIFSSCGTNNNVVSNRLISKRKFNKGFHFNSKGNTKSSNEKKQEESIAFDDSKKRSSRVEKNEVRTSKKAEKKAEISEERVAGSETLASSEGSTTHSVNRLGQDAADFDSNEDSYDAFTVDVEESQEQESNDTKKADKKRKKNKKSNDSDDTMFILIVILTVLIPPLGVAVYTNIDWMKVLICLLLTFLFYLPGLIYGLLVVFDVI